MKAREHNSRLDEAVVRSPGSQAAACGTSLGTVDGGGTWATRIPDLDQEI
jgi:hypothetical protein